MPRRARVHITGVITGAVLVALMTACGSNGGTSASAVAQRYVRAWNARDYRAMADLLRVRQPNFAAYQAQVLQDLDATMLTVRASAVEQRGDQARATLTNHVIAPFGEYDTHGTLVLVKARGDWRVQWSTQQLDDALVKGLRISTSTDWPDRAPVNGAGGQPLTVLGPMVRVGVQGSRITDANALTTALSLAGASQPQIDKAYATAKDHPDWFVPVVEISDARYQQIKPQIYPVPGTVFQNFSTRQTITPGLAAHLVGSVGPITAEQVTQLGAPYGPNDTVGRAGIEAQYEKQLAGSPGATAAVVDANGATVHTLATFPSLPGTAVNTTIDPVVQRAAEAALAGVTGEAAIVAMRASTGEVLATANVPTTNAFNIGLAGRYAPGSTFKIVTSADLLERGSTPSSTVSCPATVTVNGQTFRNFEGEASPSLSLIDAFAESCNNAFIGAVKSLPADSFPAAATQFGLGTKTQIGVAAFGGSVPQPATANEQAAASIGQGKIEASPLAMAGVVATVASGSWHAPRLVAGAPNDSVAAVPLDPNVVSSLRQMMAAVVARGTAAGTGLPSGTFGKTGTAEFGSASPPQTHAWFVGYRGDVAFAVLVPGGGVGGEVAAPLAAKFLAALPG